MKLTNEYKNKLNAANIEMITYQTADKTFRMLYTATNNADYLTQANEETASDIQLIDTYFLKRKPLQNTQTETTEGNQAETTAAANSTTDNFNGPENIIYMVYSATVTNETGTEKIYFIVEYDNIYVAADGSLGNTTTDLTKSYKASSDGEKLVNENVNSANNMKYYDIIKL